MGPGGEVGLRLDQLRFPLGVWGWDAESLGQCVGRQAGEKQIPASGLVLGLAGTRKEGPQIAPMEACKPLTTIPETPLPFCSLKETLLYQEVE